MIYLVFTLLKFCNSSFASQNIYSNQIIVLLKKIITSFKIVSNLCVFGWWVKSHVSHLYNTQQLIFLFCSINYPHVLGSRRNHKGWDLTSVTVLGVKTSKILHLHPVSIKKHNLRFVGGNFIIVYEVRQSGIYNCLAYIHMQYIYKFSVSIYPVLHLII